MTGFWRLITGFGEAGIFWIAVALVLILIPSKRKTGLTCAVSMVLVFAVTYALKFTVCRLRPYDACTEIIPLVKKLRDYSFPSGHTSFSFAAALILYAARCGKKQVIIAIAVCVLVAGGAVGLEFMIDRSSVSSLLLYAAYILLLALPAGLGLYYKKRSKTP